MQTIGSRKTEMLMLSVVTTIFNDRAGILQFFSAMRVQTKMPSEIVVVDAGSTDGTWDYIQAEAREMDMPWLLHAFQSVGCNVAQGRNLAIEQAGEDIIVSTDIGCGWDPEWLEELVAPLGRNEEVQLVIGSWAVKWTGLEGPWALTEWALKGEQRLEATATSYTSSRSIAYRKRTWEALGKYPEDLTLAADDAVFHYLIEKAEVPRVGAPKVRCWWHRHETFRGFLKEAWRYGLGDGEATIRSWDVVLIGGRMALEAVCLVLGAIWLIPGVPFSPWAGIALLTVALLSVGKKISKMRAAVTRLKVAGVDRPLLRLLVFTYGTKWHWLRGYFAGLRRGHLHCVGCRRRLREMSPTLYQTRLTTLKPKLSNLP